MKDFIRIKDNGPIVISVETKPEENTTNFVKTLFNNDWNFAIIGIGKPWKGFHSRNAYYREFLEGLDPERLVILSDSRDVFCLRSPEYFEHAFNKFNSKIVVGLEIFCQNRPDDSNVKNSNDRWLCEPLYEFWKNKNYKPLIGEYVNYGLIGSKVKNLLEYFKWVDENRPVEIDQLSLGIYMNNFPELVDADIHNSLFHNSTFGVCAGMATNRQWKDSPNFAELVGRGSFFLHIPGIANISSQRKIYDMIKKLVVDNGVNHKWFTECEQLRELGWLTPGISDFDNGYWDKK